MTGVPLRCAIVGYGRIGRLYHELIDSGHSGLLVTHIVDPLIIASNRGVHTAKNSRRRWAPMSMHCS